MPDNTSFNESLEKGTILGDGAMGTLLYQMAMKHDTKPVEELCLSRPDSVRLAHIEYIRSGATMIQTNTFAANRNKLAGYGMTDSTSLINKAGIEIAQEARRLTGQQVWIAGSVGPIGRHLEPIGTVSLVSARKFFQEQVDALAEGGADLIILETFSDLREVELAATAATSACLPFIAQMAFAMTD
jgi:homocysteine S-methyltransferase